MTAVIVQLMQNAYLTATAVQCRYFQGLTMDVIGDAGFGMEVDAQRNPNEPFIKSLREIFNFVEKRSIFFTLAGEVTISW